jgi:hypothetical protein
MPGSRAMSNDNSCDPGTMPCVFNDNTSDPGTIPKPCPTTPAIPKLGPTTEPEPFLKVADQAINSFKILKSNKISETMDKIKQKTVKMTEISKIIRECGQKMADIVAPETNLTV